MAESRRHPLVGWGYLLLGLGLTWEGIRGIRGEPMLLGGNGKLSGPESDALKNAGGIIKSAPIYRVDSIQERVNYIVDRIRKDSLKPIIREKALAVLTRKCPTDGGRKEWCVRPKDHPAEIRALFRAVQDANSDVALRYTRDHVLVDQFHAADKLLRLRGGDCFARGTLVLKDDHSLAPVESLRVGDRIWGKDRWSTVTNTWEKGILPTWRVRLNNGSSVRLTPDHKVWALRCDRHVSQVEAGAKPCSCRPSERREERIYVRDLKPGDVLVQPGRIPYGKGEPDVRRTFVEGLYLSDGWHEPNRFAISGRDGKPKEAQKRKVEAICKELGLKTYWHRRYIRIHDREWAARVSTMGTHAPQKRALTLDLAEGAAGALFEGILADSGKNSQGFGHTLTTTSRKLFLQARVLAKMFGITCGERYVVDHGGLGQNPIWRLQLWGGGPKGHAPKLLRVRGIDKDNVALPCFDFETDDHYVWLPEADWTTSQCDDGVVLLGAMLRSVGYPVKLRVVQDKGSSTWSHIYLLIGIPPTGPSKWVPLDWSVVPFKPAGWEAPGAAQTALTGEPHGIITRVKDFNV